MRLRRKTKRLILFWSVIVILIGLIFAYLFTGNYNAEEEALTYLNSTETVAVSKIEEGYFFDGPGENTAIIFYPGAKVEYTAYAKLMYKIAESGEDCFLLEMPFNLAFFDVYSAESIMANYNYENWYISGHSLGGVIASMYVSDKSENVKGVIALASYPSKRLPEDIKYISILGGRDGEVKTDNYNKARKYLPKNSKEYLIDGANHAGFANYGAQKGDGDATITSDEQQDKVVEILNKEIK